MYLTNSDLAATLIVDLLDLQEIVAKIPLNSDVGKLTEQEQLHCKECIKVPAMVKNTPQSQALMGMQFNEFNLRF